MTAFFLTAVEDRLLIAKSMIASERLAINTLGTIVAINDKASDCAASFLDFMSDSMEYTIFFQI